MDEFHKKLLEELPTLGHWHHSIDLGEGISTNPQKSTLVYNPESQSMESYFIPQFPSKQRNYSRLVTNPPC